MGTRDRAILITLLDTGLRASELCDLAVGDAHLDEGYLKVLGKGDRERIVPIGANATRALKRYLEFFRREPLANRYLFPSRARRLAKQLEQAAHRLPHQSRHAAGGCPFRERMDER